MRSRPIELIRISILFQIIRQDRPRKLIARSDFHGLFTELKSRTVDSHKNIKQWALWSGQVTVVAFCWPIRDFPLCDMICIVMDGFHRLLLTFFP